MTSLSRYHFDSALAFALFGVLLFHFSSVFSSADTEVLIGTAFVGFVPVLWGAYKSFRKSEWASMDLLASVALIFSLLSREWVSAVFIELMLAAARILDDVTRDRTEKSIRGLLKLRPEFASVERNGALAKVRLAEVQVGDVVVAGIGERIPVDGVILSGTAAIDESSLTGESLPVDKGEGGRAMSSTLVQSGSIRIKTTHVGGDTTLERVIRLVESAREEKPDSQTLGEKFGKFYLISIFIGSGLLYAFSQDLALVLAVVLVVCADDVAVAIPITYLRAIRSAASRGVIVKGGKHLETLGRVDTFVFDKTGTLTKGKLAIMEIAAAHDSSEDEVIRVGALSSAQSAHPFSRAFTAYARKRNIVPPLPDAAEERGGKGTVAKKGDEEALAGRKAFLEELGIAIAPELEAAAKRQEELGRSISYVALNGRCIGLAGAADSLKENAKEAIARLRELGITKTIMLSGDNDRAAEAIAREAGIDEWHANLRPEQKVEIIRGLQARTPVAMVGDGVNDAAALSIAGVGIAMGGLGAEGTVESAQIVLMRDDLSALPAAIKIAHSARRISIQDFWIWGATNAAGLALVFGGIIGPAGAAAYNFLSDFLPLFNSMRVKVRG